MSAQEMNNMRAQAPEIKQMRGWLNAWYKVCNVVPESTLQPEMEGQAGHAM